MGSSFSSIVHCCHSLRRTRHHQTKEVPRVGGSLNGQWRRAVKEKWREQYNKFSCNEIIEDFVKYIKETIVSCLIFL